MTTAIFTDAPATVRIHSPVTIVALTSLLSAFVVTGLGLYRAAGWA